MDIAATMLLFHSSKMYLIYFEARKITSASRGQISAEIIIFTFTEILLSRGCQPV